MSKLTLISSATASGSASVEFTSGIDSTYDEYVFYLVDIACSTDGANFLLNFSTDGGSNYNVTKTTTYFAAIHWESDASAFQYEASHDLAQSTADQRFPADAGNEADECIVGEMRLFSPSSTTYVKHFYGSTNHAGSSTYSANSFIAGYGNTTSAVNAVEWSTSSGTFSGQIHLFGAS
jgi:hypothetical protein